MRRARRVVTAGPKPGAGQSVDRGPLPPQGRCLTSPEVYLILWTPSSSGSSAAAVRRLRAPTGPGASGPAVPPTGGGAAALAGPPAAAPLAPPAPAPPLTTQAARDPPSSSSLRCSTFAADTTSRLSASSPGRVLPSARGSRPWSASVPIRMSPHVSICPFICSSYRLSLLPTYPHPHRRILRESLQQRRACPTTRRARGNHPVPLSRTNCRSACLGESCAVAGGGAGLRAGADAAGSSAADVGWPPRRRPASC